MESSLLLSRQDIDSIYAASGLEAIPDERGRRSSDRWPYREFQLLGPYGTWGLPKRNMFCEVRCHDLSQGGISFYLPKLPTFDFAVIGLGKRPNVTFLMIRMTHSRECAFDDKKLFLVGCQFLQRVEIEG